MLAAPGSGLVHGFAHLEAAHHQAGLDGHDAVTSPERDGSSHREPAVSADDHGDHGHGRVDGGLRPRAESPIFLRADQVTVVVVRVVDVRTRADFPRAAFQCPDPPSGPPPRLRAPPAA